VVSYKCIQAIHAKVTEWRTIKRQRRIWVDIIERDIEEIKRNGTDWIGLAQDRDQWRSL
jgi:hypothetical protein